MKYLINTDRIIDHMRRVESVTRRLEELVPEGLAICVVSLAELYEGVYYSRDPERSEAALKVFLDPDLTVLGVDEEICRIFRSGRKGAG